MYGRLGIEPDVGDLDVPSLRQVGDLNEVVEHRLWIFQKDPSMYQDADSAPGLLEALEAIEDPQKRSKLHHATSVGKDDLLVDPVIQEGCRGRSLPSRPAGRLDRPEGIVVQVGHRCPLLG